MLYIIHFRLLLALRNYIIRSKMERIPTLVSFWLWHFIPLSFITSVLSIFCQKIREERNENYILSGVVRGNSLFQSFGNCWQNIFGVNSTVLSSTQILCRIVNIKIFIPSREGIFWKPSVYISWALNFLCLVWVFYFLVLSAVMTPRNTIPFCAPGV